MPDSCPECVHRDVQPASESRNGDRITHGYRCPACKHRWSTARHLPAYSELHNRGTKGRTAQAA